MPGFSERSLGGKRYAQPDKYDDDYYPTGETYGPVNSPIFMKRGKKFIKVTSGRDNRYLILPEQSIQIVSREMMDTEWERLMAKTKLPTMKQRQQMADDFLKYRNLKQEEIDNRRREMNRSMVEAGKTLKLNPAQREHELKNKYTIDRADFMLVDNEESMTEFNKIVAMKKCIATWDLQILEKEKIKEDEKRKKLRLEREMELLRRQRVKEDEMARLKENAEKQNFIRTLGEQIEERENDMKVKMELKQLERTRFNKAARQEESDELALFRQKFKDDEKLREEQRRVNVLLQRLQAIDREEDKLFFEKQQKANEEIRKGVEEKESAKRELELKRLEDLKKTWEEKEQAEEKAKFKDLMDEKLRMDDVERSWRRKELEEMEEKKRKLDILYAELEDQIVGRRISRAQAIEEERREVCKVAQDNIGDETKDKEAERKVKLANEKQRREILLQINELERRKLQEREDREVEVNFYKIKEERNVERAKNAMWRRIDQVKRDGLPEKYSLELEKHVTAKYGPRTDKKDNKMKNL